MNDFFAIADEVARALACHRPVVALETTLVTHGLPHPEGLQAAADLEAEVVAAGAVPASIGVLDGKIQVGLGAQELERLATSADTPKLHLSNLAARMAAGGAGPTTLAGNPVPA